MSDHTELAADLLSRAHLLARAAAILTRKDAGLARTPERVQLEHATTAFFEADAALQKAKSDEEAALNQAQDVDPPALEAEEPEPGFQLLDDPA